MVQLINLNPAIEVALLGGMVALVPACVVMWRTRQRGLHGWAAWQRVLTVATLFLTLDLVVFGAFTRLTDSGLGCPDWPGCYGENNPFAAHAHISAAHALLPSGPVSMSKAWIEMVHRYLATGVGALITGLMVAAWVRRRQGGLSPWWATWTFIWVCAQGAFGALTVTLKLQPIIVTSHLLGALLGVGLLTAQARVLDEPPVATSALALWRVSGLRAWGMALMGLLVMQMALGAWVSTNYAVLACSEVPLCQGQWWPDMDFQTAFRLLRPLGGDGEGAFITMPALTAIHMTHRLMAVLVAGCLLAYGVALRRWRVAGQADQAIWHQDGLWLWGLLGWQLLSGLSNVVLGWPLVAALAHTLGAALLVWRLTHVLVLPRGEQVIGVSKPAANPSNHGVIK